MLPRAARGSIVLRRKPNESGSHDHIYAFLENLDASDQRVGHTGHDPVKLPFPVGCTTPVLGGLYVNVASYKTVKGSRGTLRTNYSRS
jgi:hypothetical protein